MLVAFSSSTAQSAVPLVSPAGSVTLGEKQHTVLFFKTLAPLRYPLGKAWVGAPLHKLVGSRFAFYMAIHTVANYSFSNA